MKRRISIILIFALVFTATLSMAKTESAFAATSKGIHLSKTSLTLETGNKKKISVRTSNNVKIDNSKVTWKSGNKKIAKVNAYGTITAVSKGTVKIKATYKNKTYVCKVTVKAKTSKQTQDGKSDGNNSSKASDSDASSDSTKATDSDSTDSNSTDSSSSDSDSSKVAEKDSQTSTESKSEDSKKVEVNSLLPYAHYLGLNKNIAPIANPTTVGDYDNNILYAFLTGNYALNFVFEDFTEAYTFSKILPTRIKYLSTTYPELMGSFCNGEVARNIDNLDFSEYQVLPVPYDGAIHYLVFVGYSDREIMQYLRNLSVGTESLPTGSMEGPYEVSIYVKNAPLTNAELYSQQLAAIEKAMEIKNELHSSGQITGLMSQKEIAQFYYDYLNAYGIDGSGVREYEDNSEYMKHDTLYGALILKQSDCVGRAAIYNLFLHMEGIESQSVSCVFRTYTQVGHVLNRIVVDGTELFVDWGNEISMRSQREMEYYVMFDSQSLSMARSVQW